MDKIYLIDWLVKKGALKTPEIIKAFKSVDRADFVPKKYREEAYSDHAIPLNHGQTISQPSTVAMMLEWLRPAGGDKVLDVGSGSGWTTALLAQIVGPEGQVFGVEIIPELVEFGRKNIEKYDLKNVRVIQTSALGVKNTPTPGVKIDNDVKNTPAPGVEVGSGAENNSTPDTEGGGSVEASPALGTGLAEHAPYDKILVSAESASLPKELVRQLKNGGRMVIPISGSVWVVNRQKDGTIKKAEHPGFMFVPLIS